jgi:hypothetical protein
LTTSATARSSSDPPKLGIAGMFPLAGMPCSTTESASKGLAASTAGLPASGGIEPEMP